MGRFERVFLAGVVVLSGVFFSEALGTPEIIAYTRPLYTTAGDPADYVVSPGAGLDGVVDIIGYDTGLGGYIRGSGSLIADRYILTAAHVVDGLDVSNTTVYFDMPGGAVAIGASAFSVHPNWDGDITIGNDIAIIELTGAAPTGAERYGIYRAADEVGQAAYKSGYGRSGNGSEGDVLSSGTKRAGYNLYDSLGDILDVVFNPLPGAQLAYDFDNGLAANDAFGEFFGIENLGLGPDEVFSAPGDSGGPTLIGNQVAGITSYGVRLQWSTGGSSDVDSELNASFGELSVDTRVSLLCRLG
ncbi:MAG: trypsin-like serine protease [Planctomycetota bacterium]